MKQSNTPTETIERNTRRVGLLLLTKDEMTGQTTAHLEQRPQELDGNRTTWPGVHLVTVGTKLHEHENELAALFRQITEKFGAFPANMLADVLLHSQTTQILYQSDRITIYGLLVPKDVWDCLRPRAKQDHFTHITGADLHKLITAKQEWKHKAHDKNGIVVFPHTHEALCRALETL